MNWLNGTSHRALMTRGYTISLDNTSFWCWLMWSTTWLLLPMNSNWLTNSKGVCLSSTFKLNLLVQLTDFTAWNLLRTIDGIHIDQSGFIKRMLMDFSLNHINGVTTLLPISADFSLRKEDEPRFSTENHFRCKSLISFLAYLEICSRPEISLTVSTLSSHLHDLVNWHLFLARWVMRFIAATRDRSILFLSSNHEAMKAYVDSNLIGCHETRWSSAVIVITVNGWPIYWQSNCQTLFALSSARAKYNVISHCCKSLMWLRHLLSKVCEHISITETPQFSSTVIYEYSTSATSLIKICAVSERNKHNNLKCHSIRYITKSVLQTFCIQAHSIGLQTSL